MQHRAVVRVLGAVYGQRLRRAAVEAALHLVLQRVVHAAHGPKPGRSACVDQPGVFVVRCDAQPPPAGSRAWTRRGAPSSPPAAACAPPPRTRVLLLAVAVGAAASSSAASSGAGRRAARPAGRARGGGVGGGGRHAGRAPLAPLAVAQPLLPPRDGAGCASGAAARGADRGPLAAEHQAVALHLLDLVAQRAQVPVRVGDALGLGRLLVVVVVAGLRRQRGGRMRGEWSGTEQPHGGGSGTAAEADRPSGAAEQTKVSAGAAGRYSSSAPALPSTPQQGTERRRSSASHPPSGVRALLPFRLQRCAARSEVASRERCQSGHPKRADGAEDMVVTLVPKQRLSQHICSAKGFHSLSDTCNRRGDSGDRAAENQGQAGWSLNGRWLAACGT